MPRFSKILLLGSSALKIGEGGEFDYSGSQAIKAFNEEGIETILVNPNIATIQTSNQMAQKVYFLPVQPYFVERIIERERPDAIALSFGGQTALNCGIELARSGVLDRYNVAVLGTPIAAIEATEDRQLFADRLRGIGVSVPRSFAATSVHRSVEIAETLGYPVMIRAAFALGGLGSGACWNEEQVRQLTASAFAHAPQVLIEEYLQGWKEFEYEVVRDAADNCITVCNMENLDPLGIHTGESIVVAPSQTLSNHEYHHLRSLAIRVVRDLGIIGECNIQFAVNPKTGDYRVIEVNARLSRSSALASKATGYPLAFIAAKLGLGYNLLDLRNQVTRSTTACFEPALDYVVVKVPRWDLGKFRNVSTRIGSAMKSVGEVMAIGRTFEEAIQKAMRMLEIGVNGLVGNDRLDYEDIERELNEPNDKRIFAVTEAMRRGISVERIHELTHIDPWFLHRIANLVRTAERVSEYAGGPCPKELLRHAKQCGFSDAQIAKCLGTSEEQVRIQRYNLGLRPVVKQIDTLAAEYPAKTNFLYLTYHGECDDVQPSGSDAVIVLGSGTYRIGNSVEFDWCCVNAAQSLKELGFQRILVNYNPETVSTDYDVCDRLYFEELTLETLLEISAKEQPLGVVLSMGGQIPNNLAMPLHRAGIKVLGTHPEQIDAAEDRKKFSALLDQLEIHQPVWRQFGSLDEARQFANHVGYPVLVRPSYVLSGQAMGVAGNEIELAKFLGRATSISNEHPVVLTKFIENAKEFEYDAVAKKGDIITYAISEHVENAGVHSGDATLVLPPQRAWLETMRRMRMIGRRIAAALKISGPFNVQFIARENDVQVIECNLRASRSFPFISKVCDVNFIELATRAIMGFPTPRIDSSFSELNHVGVKAPQFSFTRLHGADPVLGVEMHSTGEVACLADDFEDAFLKAMLSVGYRLPVNQVLLSSGPLESKAEFVPSARLLMDAGVKIYATPGTAAFMKLYGVESTVVYWPDEPRSPNVMDLLVQRQVDLVINIPKNFQEEELANDYLIRRTAVDRNIPLMTDLHLAKRFVEAFVHRDLDSLSVKTWNEYLNPHDPFADDGAEQSTPENIIKMRRAA